MIQKEVADRIAAPPGSKTYGILSILLQAYYDIDYLFKVPPGVFHPPPKVDSAVIRLRRNKTANLDCDEKLFKRVVKAAFNQRRKTLRNALKSFTFATAPDEHLLMLRAERLSVADFVHITKCIAD
jgi:16S rRNA (adenine1518-N6/adenine1519-N6)-dimethyltransferase